MTDGKQLMTGKRGLVMGVANDRSIAWGIAQALHAAGAEMAFTYQGAAFGKRVLPMVEKLGCKIVEEADVESDESLDRLFARLKKEWGRLDFVVHAIAFSDKEELKGRYVDTTKANFQRSLTISCYSFTDIARRALPLMTEGGSLITLTYEGAVRVMPSYNVMGIAKAALEASVRYLAADLGPQGVRVNLVSAGPLGTLAANGIPGFDDLAKAWEQQAPLGWDIEDAGPVAGAVCFLLSDHARAITGEILHVDGGFHAMGTPLEGMDGTAERPLEEATAS
jgi:enoyl-[acyl-carrier protein] reductase I